MVKRIYVVFMLIAIVFTLAGCAIEEENNTITSGESSDLAKMEDNKENEMNWIKEHAEELLQEKAEVVINLANYYQYGTEPIASITDEQKIALAMERIWRENKETKNITKLQAEDMINQYFVTSVAEHKSIESPYVKATYKDGVYTIEKPPTVGAIYHSIAIKEVEVKEIKDGYEIICTADLLLTTATDKNQFGESIITFISKGGTYKVQDYVQTILEEKVVLETVNP